MRASRHPTILNECDKKLSVVYLLSSSVCTATSGLITPHPTLVKPNTRIPYLVYFQSPVSSKLSLSGPTSTSLYMSCDSFIARYKRTNPTRIPWVYFCGIVLQCTRMDVELVLKTLVNVGGLLGPDKYINKNPLSHYDHWMPVSEISRDPGGGGRGGGFPFQFCGRNSTVWIVQKRTTDLYFPMAISTILCKVILIFESVDEILKCDHSNESYWVVVSIGTIYHPRWL